MTDNWMAWSNFFTLIGFAVFGFIAGRMSVRNRVKELNNQSDYELDVTLDEHGVLTITN